MMFLVKYPTKQLASCLVVLLCASCAVLVPTPTSTAANERGGSRAERVFIYQSRIADALLDLYPFVEVFETAHPDLIAAEAQMVEFCSPLTRAVLTELEGRQPSLRLRIEVMTSIDDCERAAHKIDRLINAPPQPYNGGNAI